eukprot:TRINITY_DN1418_c0_g1_i1.p1 TRINITY_DN1418_c0_g1~~TRINITY_DN1418_c0_g1_i1.p1  ORF type:complete len:216 (-),score=53.57 TRINITY_DN1418_c0_g1_i1:111-758(-)
MAPTCEGPITFEELIDGLLELFSKDKESVVIEEVQAFFNRYVFNPADVAKYAKWDKFKYTRNLIHEGNSKFNLILMCWPEGIASPIHDHADSHCFMRILDGEAKETRFFWPRDHCNPDGSLIEMTNRSVGAGVTAYMSDELGLHRIENMSHTSKLCSMHLYSPPFSDCNIFDERTSKKTNVNMCFYSKYGEKEDVKKMAAATAAGKRSSQVAVPS